MARKEEICLLDVGILSLIVSGLVLPLNEEGVGSPSAGVCSKQQFYRKVDDLTVYQTSRSFKANNVSSTAHKTIKLLAPSSSKEVFNPLVLTSYMIKRK